MGVGGARRKTAPDEKHFNHSHGIYVLTPVSAPPPPPPPTTDQQLDLQTVKDMYLEKYDVTLKDALESECGGDFKRLLIEILH